MTVELATDAAAREARVYLHAYTRQPLTLVRGAGSWVWDEAGRAYLDMVAGIAVNVLGHAHPAIGSALARQAATLVHVSNLYYSLPQLELAELLVARSPFDRAFFVNENGTICQCLDGQPVPVAYGGKTLRSGVIFFRHLVHPNDRFLHLVGGEIGVDDIVLRRVNLHHPALLGRRRTHLLWSRQCGGCR